MPHLPSSFAVKPPGPYAFKSPLKRVLAGFVDALGSLFFQLPRQPVEWPLLKRIAVLRLDHLGDVLLTLPALKALRQGAPQARIDFWVGPWGKEVAELSGVADRVVVFDAPWFARPSRGDFWTGSRGLSRRLKEEGYDAVIDFRGDVRHALASWKAKIPVCIGQAVTGGRFFLTHPAHYDSSLHEVEQNMSLLRQAGLIPPALPSWPDFHTVDGEAGEVRKILESLGSGPNIIAVHPLPATPAKRWMAERWGQLMEGLPGDFDLVLIGTEGDRPYLEEIQKGCGRKIHSAAGLMNLKVLAAFLKQCRLFIGVDSGPAHIAAAMGTPVVSLFSGTNRAAQWGPWGSQVKIIQKITECSPCERQDCPFENECMRRIETAEVINETRRVIT
jgi:ADP-heptose:LPS heptosyltransferase